LDVAVRLNTNENPYPLPEQVVDAMLKAVMDSLVTLNRYPDREAAALREDLANYLGSGLTADNVWAANGSNEVQQQLLQAFGGPGRTAMGFLPSYSMHPLLASGTGTGWLAGQRDSEFGLNEARARSQVRVYQPDIVFVCSPNNPTGTALDIEVIEAIASEAPGMVIVDEAYVEFARPGTQSAISLLPRYPRLVVTRTMSKAFAVAGLRVGYAAAGKPVVDALRLVRLPYHLSALTQATARAALANSSTLLSRIPAITAERDRIIAGLRDFGLTVADSDANFVLFGRFKDAGAVWQQLLDRGVLVRDPQIPGFLRVSAGTPAETDAFLSAMASLARG
jgi:histidinol-phosphate aminotransferase